MPTAQQAIAHLQVNARLVFQTGKAQHNWHRLPHSTTPSKSSSHVLSVSQEREISFLCLVSAWRELQKEKEKRKDGGRERDAVLFVDALSLAGLEHYLLRDIEAVAGSDSPDLLLHLLLLRQLQGNKEAYSRSFLRILFEGILVSLARQPIFSAHSLSPDFLQTLSRCLREIEVQELYLKRRTTCLFLLWLLRGQKGREESLLSSSSAIPLLSLAMSLLRHHRPGYGIKLEPREVLTAIGNEWRAIRVLLPLGTVQRGREEKGRENEEERDEKVLISAFDCQMSQLLEELRLEEAAESERVFQTENWKHRLSSITCMDGRQPEKIVSEKREQGGELATSQKMRKELLRQVICSRRPWTFSLARPSLSLASTSEFTGVQGDETLDQEMTLEALTVHMKLQSILEFLRGDEVDLQMSEKDIWSFFLYLSRKGLLKTAYRHRPSLISTLLEIILALALEEQPEGATFGSGVAEEGEMTERDRLPRTEEREKAHMAAVALLEHLFLSLDADGACRLLAKSVRRELSGACSSTAFPLSFIEGGQEEVRYVFSLFVSCQTREKEKALSRRLLFFSLQEPLLVIRVFVQQLMRVHEDERERLLQLVSPCSCGLLSDLMKISDRSPDLDVGVECRYIYVSIRWLLEGEEGDEELEAALPLPSLGLWIPAMVSRLRHFLGVSSIGGACPCKGEVLSSSLSSEVGRNAGEGETNLKPLLKGVVLPLLEKSLSVLMTEKDTLGDEKDSEKREIRRRRIVRALQWIDLSVRFLLEVEWQKVLLPGITEEERKEDIAHQRKGDDSRKKRQRKKRNVALFSALFSRLLSATDLIIAAALPSDSVCSTASSCLPPPFLRCRLWSTVVPLSYCLHLLNFLWKAMREKMLPSFLFLLLIERDSTEEETISSLLTALERSCWKERIANWLVDSIQGRATGHAEEKLQSLRLIAEAEESEAENVSIVLGRTAESELETAAREMDGVLDCCVGGTTLFRKIILRIRQAKGEKTFLRRSLLLSLAQNFPFYTSEEMERLQIVLREMLEFFEEEESAVDERVGVGEALSPTRSISLSAPLRVIRLFSLSFLIYCQTDGGSGYQESAARRAIHNISLVLSSLLSKAERGMERIVEEQGKTVGCEEELITPFSFGALCLASCQGWPNDELFSSVSLLGKELAERLRREAPELAMPEKERERREARLALQCIGDKNQRDLLLGLFC